MQKKRLGNSDLELTPIGVGAWAMGGGGWAFAWGPQDDDESISAIHVALDHGVNWIDTAPVYGLGHSEEGVERKSTRLNSSPLGISNAVFCLKKKINEQQQLVLQMVGLGRGRDVALTVER